MPGLARDDGVTLHYQVDGDGPPLLLVAGMTSDGASWLPVLDALAARFTVIRPDNRTTGHTRPADAPTSIGRNADDCAALLDHLGLGRAHVVGHSMGGLVALSLAHAHAARIGALVLAASVPARSPRNAALFRALIDMRRPGNPPDLWLRAFFPWLFHPRFFDSPSRVAAALMGALAYPHAQGAAAMQRQFDALDGFDPAPLATAVPVPTLALLGADDLLIPDALARATCAAMPGIETRTLDGAGHALHWDAPGAFAAEVAAFLDRHPVPAAALPDRPDDATDDAAPRRRAGGARSRDRGTA